MTQFEDQFAGRTAVITGGADGINKAIARLLAERGAQTIIIADYDADRGQETARVIEGSTDTRVVFVRCDVSDPGQIDALFARAEEELDGRLDILVAGAGICPTRTISDTGADAWDRTLDINLRGAFLCGRNAYAMMRRNHYGRILNLASLSVRWGGLSAGVDYTASKGGVYAMTKHFAKVMAKEGITCNAVAPGIIRTKLINQGEGYDLSTIPLGRLGEPIDVARGAAFLLSDEAAYITGQTLDINGGQWMD